MGLRPQGYRQAMRRQRRSRKTKRLAFQKEGLAGTDCKQVAFCSGRWVKARRFLDQTEAQGSEKI